jgi:hypothetical protein
VEGPKWGTGIVEGPKWGTGIVEGPERETGIVEGPKWGTGIVEGPVVRCCGISPRDLLPTFPQKTVYSECITKLYVNCY